MSNRNYGSVEAKLQISLRAKEVADLLLSGADRWAAYTQRPMRQLWDSDDSSPFRNSSRPSL